MLNRRNVLLGGLAGAAGVALPGRHSWAQRAFTIVSGKVTMARDRKGEWVVFDPFGDRIDTSKSTTMGLQEAINYAAENSFDLEVIGGPYTPKGQPAAIIRCRSTVKIPPLENAHWSINGVFVDFPEILDGDGFLFDSLLHSTFAFRGTMFYRGNGAAICLFPRNGYAGGATRALLDNDLYFFRVVVIDGNEPAGFRLKAANGAIVRNRIHVTEIEGGADASIIGSVMPLGVHLTGNDGILSNWISVQALLRSREVGLKVGDDSTAGMRISDNRFDARVEPARGKGAGVVSWGRKDFFRLSVNPQGGQMGPGVVLESSASENAFVVQSNGGTPPVVSKSASKNNLVNGILY